MARSREEQLIPVSDIWARSGQDEMRIVRFLADGRRKIEQWWDGSAACSWADAQWVAKAMAEDDERARSLTAEAVAEQERAVEAERVALLKAQAQADKRGPLVGVEASYPGGDERDWSSE
jgi:hypothetical protein